MSNLRSRKQLNKTESSTEGIIVYLKPISL